MNYARMFRVCRAFRDWTQGDLAKLLNVNSSYVSLIESGQRMPSPEVASAFAVAMGAPLRLLMVLADDVMGPPTPDENHRLMTYLLAEHRRRAKR